MSALHDDRCIESLTTMNLGSPLETRGVEGTRSRGLCDPYTDLGLVAHGGMGSVRRFVLEAQITSALEHPNIVPVHVLGEGSDGLPCFSMKLVEGRTLRAEILDEAGLPWPSGRLDQLVQVLLEVCDAVAFAHSRGAVHCDIKPENITVGEFGQVYLMDWGVARVVTEGEPGDTAYIIVAGRCEVFREVDGRRVSLRELGPGEVFGETAVFTAKPRTASVEAIDDLTVMRVTGDLLIEQIGLFSHAGAFVRSLAERFRQIDSQLGRDSMQPSAPPSNPPDRSR